jgi:hypothetical protein
MWLDEDRRYGMSIAAQKASLRLSWKHKEVVINEVYSRILHELCLGSGQPLLSRDECAHAYAMSNSKATIAARRLVEKQD